MFEWLQSDIGIMVSIAVGFVLLCMIGIPIMFAKWYRKVERGKVLIISTRDKIEVEFVGRIVVPIIHRAEEMDISLKTVEVNRSGQDGLICKDNIRADIKVNFFIRVNDKEEEIRQVAESLGCKRASSPDTLQELYGPKFSEALKTVGKQMDFESLYTQRSEFRSQIMKTIAEDLNGYGLEDVVIDYLEQTPVESLNVKNVLDAVGIRKITMITEEQRVQTNDLENSALKKIGKQDLDTKLAMLEYEREERDAQAKQQRAVKTSEAEERAEAIKVEQRKRSEEEQSKIVAEGEIERSQIERERQELSAQKEKEKELIIKTEEVIEAKLLHENAREEKVALKVFEKDRKLEQERVEISKLHKQRIILDREVAVEEESIKTLRVVEESQRQAREEQERQRVTAEGQKEVMRLNAESAKETAELKASADTEVARRKADEIEIAAKAARDRSAMMSAAKKLDAEGHQAEVAADGLAKVQIQQAEALALEQVGLAEARVLKEKLFVEAAGLEEQGMVRIRIKEAEIATTEKEGLTEAKVLQEKLIAEAQGTEQKGMAEAKVLQEKLTAEAQGTEQKGLAEARVKEIAASAIEKEGLAEAKVLQEKLTAEALGLEHKGLAEAKVKEAAVAAAEKEGLVHARILTEQFNAEALGIEQKGMAEAKVKEATAAAIEKEGMVGARIKEATAAALEKEGMVQARVTQEQATADASSLEQKGMAEARVKEATAAAIEKYGAAEASSIEAVGNAEAIALRGELDARADSLNKLEKGSREHEEIKIKVEADRAVALEAVTASIVAAEAQSRVLAEAFKSANIDIVGGDGDFFKRYIQAVQLGRVTDGFVDNSKVTQALAKPYLSGESSLPADVKDVLMNPPIDSADIRNLSIAAVLGQFLTGSDTAVQDKIKELLKKAKELGLDEVSLDP